MFKVKASGNSPCSCCEKPLLKDEEVYRVRGGFIHIACSKFLIAEKAAELVGLTASQFRSLMRLRGVIPDGTRANPHYKCAAPMSLWSEKTIRKLKSTGFFIKDKPYLTKKFLREFSDRLDWDIISRYQKFSSTLIRKYSDKLNWDYISIFQKLSESLILEFSNKVDWYSISQFQKLSESFIRNNLGKLNITALLKNKYISEDLKKLIKVWQ